MATVLTTGSGGYDSNYDAIFYACNNYNSPADTNSILDIYYNNNKGVILGIFADTIESSFVPNLAKNITNYNTSFTATNTISYPQSSIHNILYGVSSITPYFCQSSFTSQNGATSIGSINGTYAVNYLDSSDGIHGRRSDLNFFIRDTVPGDTTSTGANRCLLQALLWSARKLF